ncbi:MAG: glycosyltransferase family 4 protein [Burkholderiales bacterium]|nr:glycosyltransferase family 4 protein [Phycisphaerae bacterium]
MNKPTLCMIHEGIGDFNAIAKIAKTGIEIALEAGFEVSCVAKRLDEGLAERVEWLPLHVPARLYAYKWLTARHYMKSAMRGRSFDVIHSHQPQAASFSDVFDCHYLTQLGRKQTLADPRPGIRGVVERTQERIVLAAENYVYRNWNPATHIFFDSRMTRRDFIALYGEPPKNDALPSPFPRINLATADDRRIAKKSYFGDDDGLPVVGFIGGATPRKGSRRLAAAAEREPGLKFLVGGSGSENLTAPGAGARFKTIGLVRELDRFYAACDVLLIPSLYEPLGLVAFEAAARGTPVIATPEVGALPHVLEHGGGSEWTPDEPLLPIVQLLISRANEMPRAVASMERSLGRQAYGRRLVQAYETVLKEKADARVSPLGIAGGV